VLARDLRGADGLEAMAKRVSIKWHGWVLLFLSIVASLLASKLPVGHHLNLFGYDLLMATVPRAAATRDDVAVVGIGDDNAIADEQLREEVRDIPRVFRRDYLAKVLDSLLDAGAAGVGLDIVLSSSVYKTCDKDSDRKLKDVLKRARRLEKPVILGFYPSNQGKKSEMPHDYFLLSVDRVAFLNFDEDPDEKRRSVTPAFYGKDMEGRNTSVQSISYEMAGLIEKDLPLGSSSHLKIDYRLAPVPRYAFWDIYSLAREKNELNESKLRDVFANKIVFLGYTFSAEDEHTIPVSLRNSDSSNNQASDRIHGIYVHALGAKTLLASHLLRDVPSWINWTLAAGLGLLSGTLFLMLSPLKAGAAVGSLLLFVCAAIYGLFSSFWVIPLAPLTFGLFIPGATTGSYRYSIQYRQFRHVQRFFKSYVNPQVLQKILDDPKLAVFEGQRVTVSVMFTDIRNFSTLSETMDPQLVVSGLNRYLAEMTEAVVKVDGYMNRFMGDGILAIFGAPNPLPDDGAWMAVQCGMDMLDRLQRLNQSEIFPGISEIRIGIGVHTGEAIVGNIGCYQKMDYSITGDTANLASRIEGMTKVHKVPFLISEATCERVRDRIEARFIESTQVKGRKEMVNLYEVVSLKGV
jgi:class 3 adenylate cyclase/CHASE2 domain-containing sensor protein